MRIHTCSLLSLAILPACSIAAFEAHTDRNFTESTQGVVGVDCSSHNGAITLVGVPGTSTIAVRATLSARGDSPEEAQQNLDRLQVALRRDGSTLIVEGIAPADFDWRISPSFAFAIELPPQLAAKLTSHNGEISVRGGAGPLTAITHNGGIHVETAAPTVALETHNGAVRVLLAGAGAVDGTITSHNGSVDVGLGKRAAAVEASTHNGQLHAESLNVQHIDDNSVRGTAGSGGGHLAIETHNGSVTIR